MSEKPVNDELSQLAQHGQTPPGQPDELASAKAAVDRELQAEKESRKEERFMFVAIIVTMFDALVFPSMSTLSAPIVIGFIQLIFLMVYARRCGIEEIRQIMDRIVAAVKKSPD